MHGNRAAAAVLSLAESCRFAGVDPFGIFASVFARVGSHPASRIEELLPENRAQLFGPAVTA